jgi:hypothetical protein
VNYIKEAENILWHYNDLYKSLVNLDKQIAKIISRSGPKELSAVALDLTGIHGSGKSDEAYNVLFELQKLKDCREGTAKELFKIDVLLDNISAEPGCELFGAVLRKWYIEKMPKEDIANEIGYSSKQSIYSLRAKAIRKFAIQMFGIEALKAI